MSRQASILRHTSQVAQHYGFAQFVACLATQSKTFLVCFLCQIVVAIYAPQFPQNIEGMHDARPVARFAEQCQAFLAQGYPFLDPAR